MEDFVTDKPEEQPSLNPLYQVAQTDSKLTIYFVGNTAVVASIEFSGAPGVDPYQMLGASRDLERRAFQMLQMAEIEEAKNREKEREKTKIEVASKVPDLPAGGFKQTP
jgi:hypothetical protein